MAISATRAVSGFESWAGMKGGRPRARRIEPRCRSDNFYRGLEARWADPLWALARQWQFGEYQAEDTGSPIKISVQTKTSRIESVELGGSGACKSLLEPQTGDEESKKVLPLEPLVEHQYIHLEEITSNWRMRVQIGQQFERILCAEVLPSNRAARIICELRKLYPMEAPKDAERKNVDRTTQRFLSVMIGRVIDGGGLLDAVHISGVDTWTLPPLARNQLGANIDVDAIDFVLGQTRKWFETLYGRVVDYRRVAEPEPTAWVQESLEYQFKVCTTVGDEEITLSAPSYRSGGLDWYTFDVETEPTEKFDGITETEEFIPTRISFHGMPHPRWWAFEDGQTDFGNMETATTDLAKMMIMQFALIYGNDWFIIPLPVDVGTITRIESLIVTDVFGVETVVEQAKSVSDNPWDSWQMFNLARQDDPYRASDFLFLPPTVSFKEESPPLEEVQFLRDEMANMVWAVEHTVRNGLGQPFGGFEAQTEKRARQQEADCRERIDQLQRLKEQLLQQLGGQAAGQDEETAPTRESLRTKVDELEEQIKRLQSNIASAGLAPQPETSPEVEAGLPRYRLATTVPANWIPFVPVRVSEPYSQIGLRQAEMIRNDKAINAEAEVVIPMTRIIAGDNGNGSLERLREEAVMRAGQKYQLTRQRVRWLDGKTFVWTGRNVGVGKGEESSGLRSDDIKYY